MKKGRFVAGNHLCWFSRNEDYKKLIVNECLKEHPEYIVWCKANLKYLRFGTSLSDRINKARKLLNQQTT